MDCKLEFLPERNDSRYTKHELYLEFHNDWLKTFNEKYLLEYDR